MKRSPAFSFQSTKNCEELESFFRSPYRADGRHGLTLSALSSFFLVRYERHCFRFLSKGASCQWKMSVVPGRPLSAASHFAGLHISLCLPPCSTFVTDALVMFPMGGSGKSFRHAVVTLCFLPFVTCLALPPFFFCAKVAQTVPCKYQSRCSLSLHKISTRFPHFLLNAMPYRG